MFQPKITTNMVLPVIGPHHRCFPANFPKIFRAVFAEHLWTTISGTRSIITTLFATLQLSPGQHEVHRSIALLRLDQTSRISSLPEGNKDENLSKFFSFLSFPYFGALSNNQRWSMYTGTNTVTFSQTYEDLYEMHLMICVTNNLMNVWQCCR